ncbi:MAG: metal dependent phosphohydrolase [Firmicutes bacterium]|nr:metal dependent phosphohydrolase [Bacillota bacterium]
MEKMNFDSFISRNGLIPLTEAGSIPDENIQLSLPKLHNFITDSELNANDFYINISNPEKPFCYYKGAVFLEFSGNILADLKQRIITIENHLNKAVADRDFTRFLKIVDPRLAPDLFMEVFSFIPDSDKYPLFLHILNDNQYCKDVFSSEFINKASQYKNADEKMPLTDEWGYVKIFTCASQIEELENQTVWYTNINNAIKRMISTNPRAEIFQAQVNIRDIKSYSSKQADKKVTLDPLRVIKIKQMDLIKISELQALMRTEDLVGWYFYYARQIKSDWFYNPNGIHALSHTKRVLLLGLLLVYLEKLSDHDRDVICEAAVFHDIGRITDGYDTSHGIASYRKLFAKGLQKFLPAEDQETIRFIIELHAVADKAATKQLKKYDLNDIDHTLKLYNIFKDADGLDRVRINDLNPDYLRSTGAHKLLLLAHQLFLNPEYEELLLK